MFCPSPGNDHLKKKVLKAGKGQDSRPQKGQNVKIHLKASLKDGSLVEEQPELAFTLGDGDVIQVKTDLASSVLLFKWECRELSGHACDALHYR